jgi:hypothetical protein
MRPMMQDHLSRFEDRIQHLVEGGFARLFAGRLHPREVAVRLAHAMEDAAYTNADGQMTAPDIYTIRLNPIDHDAVLEAEPTIARTLAAELADLAHLSDFALTGFPEVRLVSDEEIAPHQVEIGAQLRGHRTDTTEAQPMDLLEIPAPDAVLVLNGGHEVPLTRPILNLGRQRDNHIILDDSRISRHHAQMRLRFGRYVIFDLNSSGGTTVNGLGIKEAMLKSGDVIGLAGFTLIYVEHAAPADRPDPTSGTQPYPTVP